jgi:hypothetical protein
MPGSGGYRRLALFGLLVAAAASATGSASAAELVSSSFDNAVTGQNPPAPWLRFEYAGVFRSGLPVDRQLQIVRDPRRRGRAAKFIVNPGDEYGGSSGERALLSLNIPSTGAATSPERDGADFYYAWSNLFPQDWTSPPNWGIVLEFHGDSRFSLAPLRINTSSNTVSVDMTTGSCVTSLLCAFGKNFPIVRHIERDRWQDFVMHVRWSKSDSGLVTVWHRVEQAKWKRVLRLRGVPTLPSIGGQPDTAIDVLFGLYTGDGSTTRVVYGDNFARTASFRAAASVFPPVRHKR